MITFFGGLPSSARFTASSARTAASISALRGVRAHRHVGALLAVDLDRQRDRVLDQQSRSTCGQAACATRVVVAERRPAFLGEMRHHRMEQLHQNVGRFAHRPAEIGRRTAPFAPIGPIFRPHIADYRH